MLNDKEILKIFLHKENKVNPSKTSENYLKCHPEEKEYLDNRYPKEEFISYGFIIQRILFGLEKLRKCPICNNYIFDAHHTYCSRKCFYKDKEAYKLRGEKHKGYKHSEEVKKEMNRKCKETLAKKYPDDPSCGRFGSKKHKQVMIDKYGDENYNNLDKNKETCLKKYGVEYYFQSEEFKEKSKDTLLKKTGYEHNSKNPEDRKKASQSYKYHKEEDPKWYKNMVEKRFNTAKNHNSDDPLNSAKANKTKLERYGTFFPKKIYKLTQAILDKYNIFINIFDNEIIFDSFPELLYYLDLKLKNKNIYRNTELYFTYKIADKEHKYYPDFILDNKIIEVKADSALNDNNELINMYNKQSDEMLQAKTNIIKENNIKLIKTSDIFKQIKLNNYFNNININQLRKDSKIN